MHYFARYLIWHGNAIYAGKRQLRNSNLKFNYSKEQAAGILSIEYFKSHIGLGLGINPKFLGVHVARLKGLFYRCLWVGDTMPTVRL